MKILQGLILVLLLAPAGGCVTTDAQQQDDMRRRAELERMRLELDRLGSEVESSRIARQDMFRELEALKARLAESERSNAAALRDVQTSMSAMTAAQEKARQEMIEQLSKRMADLIKSAAPRSGGGGAQSGYEHVVKQGETLSQIAAAYGVTAHAIARANNIADPNTIRVGQTLFIPD